MDLVAILLKFVIYTNLQVFLEKQLIHYRKLENQRRSLCLILDNTVLIRLRLVRIQILLLKYLHYRTFPESQGLRVKLIFGSAFKILVEKCNKTFVGKKLKTKTKYFTLKFEILLFINILELTI